MFTIKIKPNSNKHRELIRTHGEVWLALGVPKNMLCFWGQLGIRILSKHNGLIRNIRVKDTSWGKDG